MYTCSKGKDCDTVPSGVLRMYILEAQSCPMSSPDFDCQGVPFQCRHCNV
jgi:hypothetical protein